MSSKQNLTKLCQKIAHLAFMDLSKSFQFNLERFYAQLVENILLKCPETLTKYGFSAYSKNEEDVIIAETLKRSPVHNVTFIEFCVHATENNTMNVLVNGGWGTWVDKGLTNLKKSLKKIKN